ncbi:MAG TPA: IclR family transcriptional regulator [Yaniella sp.]
MSSPRNSVVHNVIDVLRCFSSEKPLVGVTEIANEVGLHKSSVSRLLATLETEGWVEQDPTTRKYRLGLGLIAIAGPLLANLDVRKVAYPYLVELAAATQETAVLAVWEASAAVTVEQIAADRTIKHTSPLGARYSSTGSASVQIFLADMAPETVRTLLDKQGTLLQEGWAYDDLTNRLARVRERGYSTNVQETFDDEIGIAAPVYDHRHRVVAAVLTAAPAYRTNDAVITDLIHKCVAAANKISTRLGNPTS